MKGGAERIPTRTNQWSWYAREHAQGREQEEEGKRVRAKRRKWHRINTVSFERLS